MSKLLGTVPLFASHSWHSNTHTGKASQPASRKESLSESIPLQRLQKKPDNHLDANLETLAETSAGKRPKSIEWPEYFSFPKVDGWSDYDSASSTHSLRLPEDTLAVKSLRHAQQALIQQPPLPRPVLSWNLPPILQVPLRWILSFRHSGWDKLIRPPRH